MSVLPQRSSGTINNNGGILRKGARIPSPTAPNGAVMGDIWYDTAAKILKVWNGTAWDFLMNTGSSAGTYYINGGAWGWIDSNGFNTGRAYMGKSGAHGGAWAQFSHSSYWNSSPHYGYMHNGGSVLLSADEVLLRYQNSDRLRVYNGSVEHTVEQNQWGSIHMKDNWVRSVGAVGWYNQSWGYGIFMETADTWVRTYAAANFFTGGGQYRTTYWYTIHDDNHRMRHFNQNVGTPTQANQGMNGICIQGYTESSLGTARHDNMLIRTHDNSDGGRIDLYSNTHAFNGFWVDSGTKSFLIDHPVLGKGYKLQYAAIEAPAADLLWRGKVSLVKGKAVVNIDDEAGQEPGTFEALVFADDIQWFLYNESSSAHPTATLSGADLTITSSNQTATIGWMVLAVRKAEMGNSAGVDLDGRMLVEYPKDELELDSTSWVSSKEEEIEQERVELLAWKEALPGSEKKFDQLLVELDWKEALHEDTKRTIEPRKLAKRAHFKEVKKKAKERKDNRIKKLKEQ